MWVSKGSDLKLSIRPALDGSKDAISFANGNNFLRISSTLAFFQAYDPQTANIFNTAASFYLRPALNGDKNAWSFSPVDSPSKYLAHESFRLKIVSNSDTLAKDSASFLFDSPLLALPSTFTANFTCLPGGTYGGALPLACTRVFCRDPALVRGIDFTKCSGKQFGDECSVTCSAGYTAPGGAPAQPVSFKCGSDRQYQGTLPTCEPSVCSVDSVAWPANVVNSQCQGKKTGDRCFVSCNPGYTASAELLSGIDTTVDLNYAPYTARPQEGCKACGSGSYASYPCDNNDPVTSCMNWCKGTSGCQFFRVNMSGSKKGTCCLLAELPNKASFSSPAPEVSFFSMSASYHVVDTRGLTVKNLDDLKKVCTDHKGLSLVSITDAKKLEDMYELVASKSFINLNLATGIPIAYSPSGDKSFVDFNNIYNLVHPILRAAGSDFSSAFSGKTDWASATTKGVLVGFGNGANNLFTFDYSSLQAVLCERSFVCSPSGKIDGQIPTCNANQCSLPTEPGTDYSLCAGKRTGQTCPINCLSHRESTDTAFSYPMAVSAAARQHSIISRLPQYGPLNVGFVLKVTTDQSTWGVGSLITLGGSSTSCCDGSLTIFAQADASANCRGTNKFAIGVGMTCNTTDVPLMTACTYDIGKSYSVRVQYDDTTAKILVDETEAASAPRKFVLKPNKDSKYDITYLNGCHNQNQNQLKAIVQFTKIWTLQSTSTLTCTPSGFTGRNPCIGTCGIPDSPANVNFTACSGISTGKSCLVSCYEGSPSVDIGYQTETDFSAPSRINGYMSRMPVGTVMIDFVGKVSTDEDAWDFKDFLTIGGSVSYCCGNSWYVFTTSRSSAGCIPGLGKYAIGFGTQCDNAHSPIITSCEYSKGVYYNIQVTYGNGVASINVNGQQKATGTALYSVAESGVQGYAITYLNGCHDQDHEALQGEVLDLKIYSMVQQYPLQCEKEGTFSGTRPTCLDSMCAPPQQASGVNYMNCFNKKVGESCLATCNPGYSEDGVGQDDVREDALLWLEAEDMRTDATTGRSTWIDRRGASFSSSFTIEANKVSYDANAQGIRFSGEDNWVKIFNLDINPSVMPEATLEAWVKLNVVSNNRGWLFGHDSGNYGRHLILHDTRFGGADSVPTPAQAVGTLYKSQFGATPVGVWLHVVGTWKQGGRSVLYVNGIPDPTVENTNNLSGDDYLILGGHAHASGHFVSGVVSSVRVYSRSLLPDEVNFLYLKGRISGVAPSDASTAVPVDVREKSLLWLESADITGSTWLDHRGSTFNRYTMSLVGGASNDANNNGVMFTTTGHVKVGGLDISASSVPSVTLEAWVKFISIDAAKVTYLIGEDNGGFERSIIANHADFQGSGMGVGHKFVSSLGVPETGVWTHFVTVWDGNNATIYKNGVKYRSEIATITTSGLPDLYIGGNPAIAGATSINGWVNSVRVYGFAVSQKQIESLYATTYPRLGSANSADSIISSSILYLEARDVASTVSWPDHRGARPVSYSVSVNATYDSANGGLRFSGDATRARINAFDISQPATTIEAWVKLNSIPNDRGFVLGNGGRAIMMHDSRYGPGNGARSSAAAVQTPYASNLGYPKVGQWIHVVAAYNENGASTFYRDGVAQRIPGSTKSVAGLTNLILGGHPSDTNSHIDGWISTVRVYDRTLTDAEVLTLFARGQYASMESLPHLEFLSSREPARAALCQLLVRQAR